MDVVVKYEFLVFENNVLKILVKVWRKNYYGKISIVLSNFNFCFCFMSGYDFFMKFLCINELGNFMKFIRFFSWKSFVVVIFVMIFNCFCYFYNDYLLYVLGCCGVIFILKLSFFVVIFMN